MIQDSGTRAARVERLRFSSLREAQAIWRTLNGEDVQSVSQSVNIPLAVLLPWLEPTGERNEADRLGRDSSP
jgi:hypothetical protein